MTTITKLARRLAGVVAVAALVVAMGGTWMTVELGGRLAVADPDPDRGAAGTGARGRAPDARGADATKKSAHKELAGKLNLNTATEEQLMLLPTVGPSKAERIVAWRKKNGGFKRIADLRRVKGFGYKTFKQLEPYLDIKGDTTLAARVSDSGGRAVPPESARAVRAFWSSRGGPHRDSPRCHRRDDSSSRRREADVPGAAAHRHDESAGQRARRRRATSRRELAEVGYAAGAARGASPGARTSSSGIAGPARSRRCC